MKHLARIIKGKFVYTNPKKLESQLKRLDDTSVIVEVYKHIPKRSGALNQYYWKVVVSILGDELGYSKEEMHEVLKAKFLYKKEMIGLEWVKISRSTTDLGNKEFIDYIDKIKIFASMELSIYIPDPNEI
jgi:hypothetical protein|tara:strand:+ start:826 stop:1215 length:390 start_codon:yes stop_codon:yes gene_type:complete